MMLSLSNVLVALSAVVLLFAGLHDIAFRVIPNWVSVVLVVTGGLLRVLDAQFAAGVVCGVTVFVLAVICWWRGWMGGGDVKLLGATAVLVPPALVPAYIVSVALAGGLLGLLYLLLERLVPVPRLRACSSFLQRILTVEARRIRRRLSLPYATAISAAALLMLAKG